MGKLYQENANTQKKKSEDYRLMTKRNLTLKVLRKNIEVVISY